MTALTTKCWLISKHRFADLIEYTQTHNVHFEEEANAVITKVTYNSPFNLEWKMDISPQGLVESLIKLAKIKKTLTEAELDNQAKAQQLKQAVVNAEQENKLAILEQEKMALEIEKQRLELLEKRLDVQKRGMEYALDIASNFVDAFHNDADQATRSMEMQTLVPNILQLFNSQGAEFSLIPHQNSEIE